MNEQIFSDREGLTQPIAPQSADYLPLWARASIEQCIKDLAVSTISLNVYPIFKPYIWKVLGTRPPTEPMGGPFKHYVPKVLESCLWWECYDILEQVCQECVHIKGSEECLTEFTKMVNAVFSREGIVWKLDQGKIIRTLTPKTAQQLGQVVTLLADPRFIGPDIQFLKAIDHLNRRPEPDEENCVKDAIGALEAVANIIVGSTDAQLNDLLKKEPLKSGLHPTISQAIDKVYAYRGAAPGSAHGQVGPTVVQPADAMWVLAVSGATIQYLVDKFVKTITAKE
jgi:hypothetical protein